MIKYFDIWPAGVDKNNLFEEQKMFLIYLMGMVPDKKEWNHHVKYKVKLKEIEEMKIGNMELDSTELDLAKMQNRDIEELRIEKFENNKKLLIKELNSEYGMEPDKKEDLIPEIKVSKKPQKEELWDILQGKGLIKDA